MRRKTIAIALLLLHTSTLLSIYFCNKIIETAAAGKLYDDVANIPYNKTGLLLGTSKHLLNGKTNLYYTYRIDAAAKLIKSGKIKYLIISGDNSRKEYSEPEDMRNDLILSGIDSTKIYLDYAGFRTFDSMVRLKDIFDQDSVTIISQPFHNERAIYIASREGISAIGFNAKDVSKSYGIRVLAREKLARVKVFADFLFGKAAKFSGKKVPIPAQ